MSALFFVCLGLLVHTYVGYPLSLAVLRLIRGDRSRHVFGDGTPTVTLVISAYNEEGVIRRKIENSLSLDYPANRITRLVVSDGSTDATDAIVREFAGSGVTLRAFRGRRGKVACLNDVLPGVSTDLVVLSDANSMYDRESLRRLVDHFADPSVGCICGRLRYANPRRLPAGEGERLYWSYEGLIKRLESSLGSLLGSNGAIYAFRPQLFRPVDPLTFCDDVIPIRIAIEGRLVLFEPKAVCTEEAVDEQVEKRRRQRHASFGLRSMFLVGREAARRGRLLLLYQCLCHRVLRWLGGLLLIGLLVSSQFLAEPWAALMLGAQALFYGGALVEILARRRGVRRTLFYLLYYYLVITIAGLRGLVAFLGRSDRPHWEPREPHAPMVSLDKGPGRRYMTFTSPMARTPMARNAEPVAPGNVRANMVPRIGNPKRLLLVAGDVVAVCLANLLAIALRFDFTWSGVLERPSRTLELVLLDVALTPLTFYACGLYQGYWKYTGLDDLVRLARAVAYRTVAVIVAFYGLGFYGLSRAVVIMSTILLLLMTGALRVAPRFHFEFFSARRRGPVQRALIVGAGDTGESLLRELRMSGHLALDPIGFVDDDPEKMGAKIHGVPVLGRRKDLEALIGAHGVREVVIAIPSASSTAMREIFEACVKTGARFRTVPTRGELDRGAARISQIRMVDLEDLLGREVIDLNQHVLRERLSSRRVLITGAAGSIGREIARQVAAYTPAELIVLDRNENNLFYLEAELQAANPLVPLTAVVADVCDRQPLESLFRQMRPEIVFHAAAYKHVPLMEQNPLEAIKNNVLATRHLAEVAIGSGVDRFIFISTDKAVRPTSVMGATKRLGERLIKSFPVGRTRFMAVRFGNVLGSDGSVVPTFRRQIAAGGPVTVTHRDATRYFMTIPEAVQLVLMAGSMGEGGELFLLEMGQPVRIVDLARNLIELSGLKPDEDVKIVFTGLRPGEKLHEELKGEGETSLPTPHEKILVLSGVEALDLEGLRQMQFLEDAAREGKLESALAALRSLVPEYLMAAASPRLTTGSAENVVDIGRHRRPEAQV